MEIFLLFISLLNELRFNDPSNWENVFKMFNISWDNNRIAKWLQLLSVALSFNWVKIV